jgi:hypothetical protein
MTPKEKAKQLIDKMMLGSKDRMYLGLAKQSAIIAVDEILDLSQIASFRRDKVYMEMEYWGEVIKEIEKL